MLAKGGLSLRLHCGQKPALSDSFMDQVCIGLYLYEYMKMRSKDTSSFQEDVPAQKLFYNGKGAHCDCHLLTLYPEGKS